MTATTTPPQERERPPSRSVRFSAMESLGFSDASSVWVDRPSTVVAVGRRPQDPTDALADWQPGEVGGLDRSNIRWGLMVFLGVLLGSVAYAGYWLHQRPETQAAAAISAVQSRAAVLAQHVDDVARFNETLATPEPRARAGDLSEAEAAARALFEASAALPASESRRRQMATTAAGAMLDAIGSSRDALSYRLAVAPVLLAPVFETDPELIALDEAARGFGDWQLAFDQVRTALPDGVLTRVTDGMDALSVALPQVLSDYVDALRSDDPAEAQRVVTQLGSRLTEIADLLDQELDFTDDRVVDRLGEAREALRALGA